MTEERYCIGCKFFVRAFESSFRPEECWCWHEKAIYQPAGVNLVFGPIGLHHSAEHMRDTGACGREGKLFEPKETK